MNTHIAIPLPQDPKQKLTEKQRNVFQSLITETLKNRVDLHRAATQLQRQEMLESYRKRVGWHKMKAALDKIEDQNRKLQREAETIEKQMRDVGLSRWGDIDSRTDVKDPRHRESLIQLEASMDAAIKEPQQMEKNMILAQLWTVGTVGEAVAIINQVMSNTSPMKQLAA